LATNHRAKIIIWSLSLGGVLALYCVLLPLVREVYGRQLREKVLREDAERLRDEIAHRKRVEGAYISANRALRVLNEANHQLLRATEESPFLHAICRIVGDVGGYRMGWVGFAENDAAKSVRPVAQAGFEDGYLERANITWADVERGRGPTGTAIRTG